MYCFFTRTSPGFWLVIVNVNANASAVEARAQTVAGGRDRVISYGRVGVALRGLVFLCEKHGACDVILVYPATASFLFYFIKTTQLSSRSTQGALYYLPCLFVPVIFHAGR